jgi:hypothetical protein
MKKLILVIAAVFGVAADADAQSQCWVSPGVDELSRFCNAIAQHAHMAQAAVGIAATAGNPVPGASSTLGMRIKRIPRITLAARATGAFTEFEGVRNFPESGGSEKGIARTFNLDAAVGVHSGFALAPTIGGFASLDLLLSAGKVGMPDEFTETGSTWAVGARLGILRESFTAPGISLTGMYRHIGDIRYGNSEGCALDSCAPSYRLEDNSVLSGRAVVGKRLFVVGANVGVGYDRFSSQPSAQTGDIGFGSYPELKQDRFTAFGNQTWTMLLLNIVVEGGYQSGDDFDAPLPDTHDDRAGDNTYYGSVAIRLAL